MLESLAPTESSQDKGNIPVRSRPEENFPEWKSAFSVYSHERKSKPSVRETSSAV